MQVDRQADRLQPRATNARLLGSPVGPHRHLRLRRSCARPDSPAAESPTESRSEGEESVGCGQVAEVDDRAGQASGPEYPREADKGAGTTSAVARGGLHRVVLDVLTEAIEDEDLPLELCTFWEGRFGGILVLPKRRAASSPEQTDGDDTDDDFLRQAGWVEIEE
eukprot:scaffold1642_cov252-Pinguiococcus_pyrenoidosus.AAC.31